MGSDNDGDLKRHLANGEVDAFVGAGMSVGAGLPDWYTLISELAGRIGYEMPPRQWATGDALIDAAQAYVNQQGLYDLISHLKDRLDTIGVQPTAAHRALAQLPVSLVFTASYDDLLERAFRDAGRRVETATRDNQIPFMRRGPDTVNIVKLYGDLGQPDTIVLARQQYDCYFLRRPQLVKLLETELARSDMLYLGWSHSDPHFNLVFGELLCRYEDFMRPGYAAMFDAPDVKRHELVRKHIRLVELQAGDDRTAQLAAWLECLAPVVSSRSLTSAPGQEVLSRYRHLTEERLLADIEAGADLKEQSLHEKVQVLCWRLREKQAAARQRIEQLEAEQGELEQSGKHIPQRIRDESRATRAEISRLENLIRQTSQRCRAD